ncbi:hypothetical protein HOLleu_04468 [Holothuria leucospilota]|uniref:Reverse transcriptase domain-containing protein n=1 Tax=Holothuria leucospilota TaxID=206669 RepID=A0A9Q1HMB6_HOLLE|nr:hypothetical protein HOLleu_04468 [Holothuria leucospilota]
MGGATVVSYGDKIKTVNVLHVPFEQDDNVIRFILGRYGKVIRGRFLTFPEYPEVFNGIRQYQIELEKDIPSALHLGGRYCWIRYYGQPRTCLKCNSNEHFDRNCTETTCFRCKQLGHVEKDCKADISCSTCKQTGHGEFDCPLSFANRAKPTSSVWDEGEEVVVEGESLEVVPESQQEQLEVQSASSDDESLETVPESQQESSGRQSVSIDVVDTVPCDPPISKDSGEKPEEDDGPWMEAGKAGMKSSRSSGEGSHQKVPPDVDLARNLVARSAIKCGKKVWISCAECRKGFASYQSYRKHLVKAHGISKPVRHDNEGRVVSVLCTRNGFSIRLCNFYAPNSPCARKVFYDQLWYYLRGAIPVVIAGDFNCVSSGLDRRSDSQNSSSYIGSRQLGNVIAVHNLIDCWRAAYPDKPGHTWVHSGKRQSSRLDRIYLPGDATFTDVYCVSIPWGSPEVERLMVAECRGAFIRSRERVLGVGERMSGFFHCQEKKRAVSRDITAIRDFSGKTVEGDDILPVFHEFYSKLYAKDTAVSEEIQDCFLNCLSNELSEEMKVTLDEPITLEELRVAIDSMLANKSPGIDGLSKEFYKVFFDIIGPDLLSVYNEVFSRGSLSLSQRTAVITLLPKEGDLLDPANRRPISLLTVDYKILSKVLQLRISTVMNSVVNPYQTCSVPGRSIHNNLFVLRDVIDYVGVKGNACAIISLDQHKAFDKVNWAFLFKVLKKMNFGNTFCRWISILYHDIYSKVLINGRLTEEVCIGRGVRQGCPLSPSLYVLFIEPLAQFISQSRDIRGFVLPGSGGRVVKFLQYADDATCIASSLGCIKGFFNATDLFHSATGASVNLKKTHGLKLGAFSNRKLPGNIDWSTTGITVTGVTFGSPNSVFSNWESKLGRLRSLVSVWKSRSLTLLEKVHVINTVLYPLFYFIAPVFNAPERIIKEVLKETFNFLWAGKTELVARNIVVLNKLEGGLGLDDLTLKLKSLLVRPLLDMVKSDHLESHFLLTRYFVAKRLRRYCPNVWSNMLPNSDNCTVSLSEGCKAFVSLLEDDNEVLRKRLSLKDIVYHLRPKGLLPRVCRKLNHLPWETIWKFVFNPLLEVKFKSFQWRVAHLVLLTGDKLRRWGISNGMCPYPGCKNVESIFHVFGDCARARHVLRWVNMVYSDMAGQGKVFDRNFFIFGAPAPPLSKAVINRLWVIFCSVKLHLWKARCEMVFESNFMSNGSLLRFIKCDITTRVEADFSRLDREKFLDLWVKGVSFVSVCGDKLAFKSYMV